MEKKLNSLKKMLESNFIEIGDKESMNALNNNDDTSNNGNTHNQPINIGEAAQPCYFKICEGLARAQPDLCQRGLQQTCLPHWPSAPSET